MRARQLGAPVFLGVAYLATAWLGLLLDAEQRFVVLMWAPMGLALGAVVRWGPRLAPGVTLGTFATALLTDHSAASAIWIASVDTIEVLLAAWILRSLHFRTALERVRDVVALLAVAGPMALLSAVFTTIGFLVLGDISPARIGEIFPMWWFSHASAHLVVAPIVLTWSTPAGTDRPRRRREAIALVATFVVVSAQAFGLFLPSLLGTEDVYIVAPLVLWTALRFGPRGTALASFVLAVMAIHSWTTRQGPFELVADAQVFISTLSISSLVLASLAIERERAVKRKAAIVAAALDSIITMDRDGRIVEINPAAERLFGISEHEAIGRPVASLIPADLRDRHRAGLSAYLQSGTSGVIGHRVRFPALRADGSVFSAEISVTRMPIEDGGMFTGFVRDVTSERSEMARRDALLRHAEELAHLGSFSVVLPTNEVQWSEELFRIYGRDPATYVPTIVSWLEAVYPADRERVRVLVERAIVARQQFGLEQRIVRPDGSVRVLVVKGQVFGDGSQVVRIAGCCQDITDRTEAERARDRLVKMVESSEDAIITLALDGTIESWNAGATHIFGHEAAYAIGRSCQILVPADQADRLGQLLAAVQGEQHVARYEQAYVRRDGSTFPASVTMSVITDQDNRVIGLSMMLRDIGEQKTLENDLRESLAEKEMLLREIHHRVKNNLQVISSLLSLQLASDPTAPARKNITDSQARIQSMALVHRLLYQSKDLEHIDFAEYLRRLAERLFEAYNVWPDRIALSIDAVPVHLDIDHAIPCGLIVNEIVANSLAHAFPDDRRGHIWIELAGEGQRLALTIRDDGVGMPPDIDIATAQSFGLQIARTLSEQLDGEITLVRDGGTTIRVTFPIEPADVQAHGNYPELQSHVH